MIVIGMSRDSTISEIVKACVKAHASLTTKKGVVLRSAVRIAESLATRSITSNATMTRNTGSPILQKATLRTAVELAAPRKNGLVELKNMSPRRFRTSWGNVGSIDAIQRNGAKFKIAPDDNRRIDASMCGKR